MLVFGLIGYDLAFTRSITTDLPIYSSEKMGKMFLVRIVNATGLRSHPNSKISRKLPLGNHLIVKCPQIVLAEERTTSTTCLMLKLKVLRLILVLKLKKGLHGTPNRLLVDRLPSKSKL